jgi:hypothetical protein
MRAIQQQQCSDWESRRTFTDANVISVGPNKLLHSFEATDSCLRKHTASLEFALLQEVLNPEKGICSWDVLITLLLHIPAALAQATCRTTDYSGVPI